MNNTIASLPLVSFDKEFEVKLGPVKFYSNGKDCVHLQTMVENISSETIKDALYCLYFSFFSEMIYENTSAASFLNFELNLEYKKKVKNALILDTSLLRGELIESLDLLIEQKYQGQNENSILQAIHYFIDQNLSYFNKPLFTPPYRLLMLSLGFQVLLHLNPQSPAAGLRQELRPILHLKFSKPIELLWGFVDQFYKAVDLTIKGDPIENELFDKNPNINISLHLIAEKLLIYCIYQKITKHPETQTINPARVLTFFWSLEALNRKLTFLSYPSIAAHEKEITFLTHIVNKHLELEKLSSLHLLHSEELYIAAATSNQIHFPS